MKNLLIKTYLVLCCTMCFVQSEAQWIETLPQNVQDGILWKADHEDNDLCEWTMCGYQYPGGNLHLDTPEKVTVEPSTDVAHSGNYSALSQIREACRREGPKKAVRLMRATNTAWDNGGEAFPARAYYSTWMYLPQVYNSNTYTGWDPQMPDNDGWWNVFQFKSRRNGASHPVFTFNIVHDDDNDEMYFYMASKENNPRNSYQVGGYKPIPTRQWVHLEAYYEHSDPMTPNGRIKFWQDGELIFERDNVVTFLEEKFVFGIGNYTTHIDGPEGCGQATIYYDDVIVGTESVHPHIEDTVTPPPSNECELIGNGDFSDNVNYWSDWNCEIELQNGEALVDISTDRAGIKKGNGTLTFEQGKTYRISFDARAQSGRNMKVRATLDYAPYTKYFEEEVSLTTSMKSFEMTFTMNQYSPDSALEFNFYGNQSNVILDNVQVSEVDCGITPPPPPPTTECELIGNGDFSDNVDYWSDWNCEIELQNGEAVVDIATDRAGIKKGNGTLTFQQGKTYRINFDARAQSGRNMKVRATLDEAPYTKYFEEEVTLTTSMESFEMTFTMDQYSSASALEFNFYGHESNVILDNVEVTELDCTERNGMDATTAFQASTFPNPFNGQTQLEYELFQDANVQINLYNAMGQLVNTPISTQIQFAGTHRIYVGENMPTGVYLCELKVDGSRKIIKIIKGK